MKNFAFPVKWVKFDPMIVNCNKIVFDGLRVSLSKDSEVLAFIEVMNPKTMRVSGNNLIFDDIGLSICKEGLTLAEEIRRAESSAS
jgi:hypothetical protein